MTVLRALTFVRLTTLSCVLALAQTAAAQGSPEALAQAREKFNRALALQTGGDWAGALTLLKEVAAIRDTPQVRFNIAIAEEQLGQLVSALGDYEIAAADAQAQNVPDVAEQADRRLESLRKRIPYLVIQRGEGARAAVVTLDGVELGQTALAGKLPVDPGGHVVAARAIGYEPFQSSIDVTEGELETITVTLVPAASGSGASATDDGMDPGADSGSNTLAWVVGGVGVASLVTAGVFYALRGSTMSDLDDMCGDNRLDCRPSNPTEFEDTKDSGQLYTTLGNVTLAVGIVGVGAAAAMLIFGGESSSEASVGVVPTAPGAFAGATFRARF